MYGCAVTCCMCRGWDLLSAQRNRTINSITFDPITSKWLCHKHGMWLAAATIANIEHDAASTKGNNRTVKQPESCSQP